MRKSTKQDECFLSPQDFMVISKSGARTYQILFDHTDKKTHACTLQNSALSAIYNRSQQASSYSGRFCGTILKVLRKAGLIRVFLKGNRERAVFCKDFFDKVDAFMASHPDYKEIYKDLSVEEKEFDRTGDEITMMYE